MSLIKKKTNQLEQVRWHVWIGNCDEEDGLSIESFRVGEASRSRQLYESIREQSIAGGRSTGKKGGRG